MTSLEADRFDASIAKAVGKRIKWATIARSTNVRKWEHREKLSLTFDDGSRLDLWDDAHECCETRYMSCDDDLATFDGAVFRGATLSDVAREDGFDRGDHGDVHDVQFLRVHTTFGDIVCQTHNEHNGWYSCFTPVAQFTEAQEKQMPETD